MNARAYVELDSYRLSDAARSVACFICHTPNSPDGEYCRNCLAPMAIAHQAALPGAKNHMIAVIGASGAGKTVFLGTLIDILSRNHDRLELIARGAFSVSLQQATIEALSRCQFPAKTPNEPDHWHWVHSQIRCKKRRKTVELVVPDIAGEALLAEMNHPGSYAVIREFLLRCTGAIVLVDTARLRAGQRDQDYFAMKLLSYLIELDGQGREGWQQRPLSIVFTKADQSEDVFSSPAMFAKRHAPGVYKQCQERFKKHQFFAAGVVGAFGWRDSLLSGRELIPLRIEPHGIVEPFEYLMENMR